MADRDLQGRLLPGHSLKSPGRPRRAVESQLAINMTARIREKLEVDDNWDRIIDKAIEQAKDGHTWARNWLAEYTIGRPAMNINLPAVGQKLLAEMISLFQELEIEPTEGISAIVTKLEQQVEAQRQAEMEVLAGDSTHNPG